QAEVISHNVIAACFNAAIAISASSQNAIIVGNTTSGDNLSAGSNEFTNAGVGTVTVGNSWTLAQMTDTGTHSINLQNAPQIIAANTSLSQSSSNSSVVTYTPTTAGNYTIAPWININSGTGNVKVSVSYTDENANTPTKDIFPTGSTTATVTGALSD